MEKDQKGLSSLSKKSASISTQKEKSKFTGTLFEQVGVFLNKYQNQILVLLIFGLALFLRVWQISTLPPGIAASERLVILQIKSLSVQDLWLGSKYYQAAYLYPAFVIGNIFGLTVRNLRLFSAFLGSMTIVLTYIFISKWFSRKIAIFTTFLFGISAVHITISRLIFPELILLPILLGLFICLTEAYRTRNIWLFGLSGLLCAAGLYASPAFLLMPFLFVVTGIYFFFKNRKFVTAYRQELIIALIAFLAGSIPYFVSFFTGPEAYLTYFGFNRSIWQIVINISQIPNLLSFRAPLSYFSNLGTEPLLDPFIAVTALGGIVLAALSASRRKYFFLLVWLFIFSLYASLKRGVQVNDALGMLPVLFTFSALALDYVIDRWFVTFPVNKRAQLSAIAVIAIFLALSSLYNYQRYFVDYKNSLMVAQTFSVPSPIPYK